jgi:hypothetical protein
MEKYGLGLVPEPRKLAKSSIGSAPCGRTEFSMGSPSYFEHALANLRVT